MASTKVWPQIASSLGKQRIVAATTKVLDSRSFASQAASKKKSKKDEEVSQELSYVERKQANKQARKEKYHLKQAKIPATNVAMVPPRMC